MLPVALFLQYPLSCPLRTLLLEHNMPSDIRDNDLQDPGSDDDDIGITDELNDYRQGSQNSSAKAEYSQPSPYHASPTGEGITMPSTDEGPIPR